jgi:hypothetical protein
MSSFTALSEIPDKWAEKGHCPICNSVSLRVIHHPGMSDHLACVSCGCAFELEMDGPHIWLLRIGPDYQTKLMPADGIWISTIELRRLVLTEPVIPDPVHEITPARIPEKEINPVYTTSSSYFPDPPQKPVVDDLSLEEVEQRALALAELGNSSSKIKSALSSSGIPDSQVSTVVEGIETKKIKKKSPLPLALAVTILIITACLSAAALYLPRINLLSLVAPFTP